MIVSKEKAVYHKIINNILFIEILHIKNTFVNIFIFFVHIFLNILERRRLLMPIINL